MVKFTTNEEMVTVLCNTYLAAATLPTAEKEESVCQCEVLKS